MLVSEKFSAFFCAPHCVCCALSFFFCELGCEFVWKWEFLFSGVVTCGVYLC